MSKLNPNHEEKKKEIRKVRSEINEIEIRKKRKNQEKQSWFFEKPLD